MVRAMAARVANIFNTESWKMARLGQGIELFRMGFMSVLSLGLDMMHIKYVGVDKQFYGVVLWLLCYELLGDSLEQNLDYVSKLVVRFYHDNNYAARRYPTYKKIRLGMFAMRIHLTPGILA